MTKAEVAALLGFCCAFDGRDESVAAVESWFLVIGEYDLADAKQAVTEHYAVSPDWIMPVHVRTRVREMRKRRLDASPVPPPPPEIDASDDARLHLAWVRGCRDAIASGQPLPTARSITRSVTRKGLPQ